VNTRRRGIDTNLINGIKDKAPNVGQSPEGRYEGRQDMEGPGLVMILVVLVTRGNRGFYVWPEKRRMDMLFGPGRWFDVDFVGGRGEKGRKIKIKIRACGSEWTCSTLRHSTQYELQTMKSFGRDRSAYKFPYRSAGDIRKTKAYS
jgi:hypothetical protein